MDKELIYTIPLRFVKWVPRWRRSDRAITEVKNYLSRHTKTPLENIRLSSSLNEVLWSRGNEKPPSRVRVRAVKFEDGGVEAEFAGGR
jgi:large subunit ribosomal protein L31e